MPDDPEVSGMRFSVIHGENQRMSGFDLGLLSLSESTRSPRRCRRAPHSVSSYPIPAGIRA
jgi:hypothetical protein